MSQDLDDGALLAAVTPALLRQRWFPARERPGTLRPLGRLPLPAPDGDVGLAHLLVEQEGRVLQVPLTLRRTPLPGAPVLGELDGWTLHDGPHDPAWVAAMLAALAGSAQGTVGYTGEVLSALPEPGAPSRVLSGEQSNTSVIIDGPEPAMLKVFRVLDDGSNPDVELTAALTRAGCSDVPPVLGWLGGNWPTTDGEASGHLAAVTRFLAGGRDPWTMAVEAARAGTDFTAEAAGIGAATRRVHQALAGALGVRLCGGDERDRIVGELADRVTWALDEAPALKPLREHLTAHRERLAGLGGDELGFLQRVHGDLHLGQLLAVDGGWRLLDFEGEPLRQLALRSRFDLPLRDVAGMLRSFDYAAALGGGSPQWAQACCAAFVEGYGPQAEPDGTVAAALLLDKALYETVYETRHRPDWVPVPLAAVRAGLGLTGR